MYRKTLPGFRRNVLSQAFPRSSKAQHHWSKNQARATEASGDLQHNHRHMNTPRSILPLLCMLLLSTGISAQTYATKLSAGAQQRLDSLYHYLDSTKLYNGNIMIGAGGEKLSSASIGMADFRTGEHLSDSSVFELASVSKQFTAAGILRLVDAGKLSLDQQLGSILPGLPYPSVSIRQMLNHTCGLPDYMPLMQRHWNKKHIATNADVLALLMKYHPEPAFEPGTQWQYSNTGYVLLASIIEKISGRSYAEFMKQEIFEPLHMEHTLIYTRRLEPKTIRNYAYGYVKSKKGFMLPDSLDAYDYVTYMDGIVGDGTVNSTTPDLLRWNDAVRERKLISKALWEAATTAPEIAGKSTGYGFGFLLITTPQRGKVLLHNGAWPGYGTMNFLFVDKNLSLVFLSNKEEDKAGTMEALYGAVINIVFDEPARFPR
jgi:CubicO group peptidase (beta-lactamase class C family)